MSFSGAEIVATKAGTGAWTRGVPVTALRDLGLDIRLMELLYPPEMKPIPR